MRVLLVAASLATFAALSGCVAPDAYAVWDPSFQGTNETAPAGNATANVTVINATTDEPLPPPKEAALPKVPMVDYAADVPVELARKETRAVTISLLASDDGLACVAEPARDPPPAPRGYAIEGHWAECELSWKGLVFGAASTDEAAATMPVTPGIPVDEFTWNMTAGRTLVNNTGTHEDILAEAAVDLIAGPTAGLTVHGDSDRYYYPFYHHEVCDASDAIEATTGAWGVETFTYTAHAHNGRAVLWWPDFGELDILEYWIDGELVEDDLGKRIVGPWGHESAASLKFTADYENDGVGFVTFSLDCPGALFSDHQRYPLMATAEGVAGGWEDMAEETHHVEVALVGI